jgi:putative sterol carrier protein
MAVTSNATSDFFARLALREHEPLLRRANGTIRVELQDGKRTDRWLVTVSKGDVRITHDGGPADCVVACRKGVFERLVSGQANPVVALLRGDLLLMGDYNLAILFQRVFPGPRSSRRKRPL